MIGHPNHGVQVSLVDTARELYEKLHRVEDNDTFVTIRADLEAEADFTGITSSMTFHSYHLISLTIHSVGPVPKRIWCV